jgi:glutathione S-transferase
MHVPVRPHTESRAADYLRINPNGRIPSLDDDGFILWESLAINLYLAEKYAPAPLWPADVKDHARAYQWSFWAANEIEPRIISIAKGFSEQLPNQTAVASGLEQLTAAFRVLDDKLGSSACLLGDAFTVADLNPASTIREPGGDGKFDVGMGGISVTLERAKKAYFSAPYMREGKTPIAKCDSAAKFQTIGDIDKPEVKLVVNPGGTNKKFARANIKSAQIMVFPDNTRIFHEIAEGCADLMITDASESRYQQKQHPGVLCAVHPDKPFDFAEKAYLLPRDKVLKQFVDQWRISARRAEHSALS